MSSPGNCYRPIDSLLAITGIAHRAGTTVGTVQSWRHRHADFPAPMASLRIGPVWDWAPVDAWLSRERKPGRPRKA
jgi:hypothetical protein